MRVRREKNLNNCHAVSETLGFIIMFGIMLTGITMVTLYGYPALVQQQQYSNIQNMERNMIVIQSDVNSLTYKAVPYKETTMQVSGGVLSVVRPDSNTEITIEDGGSLDIEFRPGNLHFLSESGDIRIALENGAVVKKQYDGSVMLSEPRWFIDATGGTTTMVITLIQVNSSAFLAKSGISTVQMSIKPFDINAGDNIYDSAVSGDIKIRIVVSEFTGAWNNYLKNTLGMTNDPIGSNTWKKENVDRIIIKAWEITIINL